LISVQSLKSRGVGGVDWPAECCAVIPCFNEAATIARLVSAVRCYLPAVMVVDDGSSDQTSAEAHTGGAQVLGLAGNQGKGAALRAGLQWAFGQHFSWALALDGDGQHRPEDIPVLLNCAEMTGADLVIGNRLMTPQQMPRLRRVVNRWMSRRLSALCGQPLADSQCGFRLLRLARWTELTWETDRFEVESEIVVRFARAGFKVEFAPVQTLYHAGGSNIDPLVDSWRWFRWWLTERRKL